MKTIFFAIAFATGVSLAARAEYSLGQLVDSYKVAKAATGYVIEPAQIKDKPYTVQVASHINEKEAIEHVEQLRTQEETVFYYPNFVKSQVFFKVCVGRFDTQEAAETFRKDFVRRMDEPFAVTISMTDRPGDDKKATKAQFASAKASDSGMRRLASVDENAPSINLKQEAGEKKSDMSVQLVKKASPVAASVNSAIEKGTKWYSLQLAAYPTEEMAKAEASKFDGKGQQIFVKAADVNGKTWYRIYAGHFKSFTEAQAFQGVYQEQKTAMTIIRKFFD
jgi:septal ring-binding cell division protein DamX